MNLFDLITKNNKQNDYTKYMPPLVQSPEIAPIQMNEDGSLNNNITIQSENPVTFRDRIKNNANLFGQRLSNALLGTAAQSTDNVDSANGALNVTVSANPRTGGILRDISSGYNENRFTPASLENFGQNKDKGLAYRLGEGLGSLARFGESPFGRSLLVGGAIGALGGSPAEMVAFGTTTGALNQANRTRDRLYRNSLSQQGIDTSNINGYLTDSMYKNATLANYRNKNIEMKNSIAQAKDNTSRAKLIGEWLKTGVISPDNANALIMAYGITDADFQESNDTRKADAIIENIENPKPKVSIMKYEGLPTQKTVNIKNTYEHLGGTGGKYAPSPLGNNNYVKIKAPNGVIKNIPADKVQKAIAAGGVRV